MRDIEFVSELFVILIDGVQDQQKTLDRFYADYDVVFPKRTQYETKFSQAIASLKTIKDLLASSRFAKRADFYALFAAVVELNASSKTPVDLAPAKNALRRLH